MMEGDILAVVPLEEAYLLGCLYARGSIEETKSGYRLIFRIPYHRYSPLGQAIIEAMLKSESEFTPKDLLSIPKMRAGNIPIESIQRIIASLKRYYPPHKPVKKPLLVRDEKGWKINNLDLANEYMDWQKKYMEREVKSISFVLKHLSETASALTTSLRASYEPSSFYVTYATIECEIPSLFFERLKSEYALDVGDIYRIARVPKKIMSFPKESLEDFMRGIADAGVHFDRAPLWKMYPRRLWHVRFGVVNTNPGLAFDICTILQGRLHIPVFCINWAGIGKGRKRHKRGGRDHFAEVWALNLRNFARPLLYNTWKQEEFEKCLKDDELTLKETGLSESLIPQLKTCPRGTKFLKYMVTCRKFQCSRLPPSLDKF